MKGSAGKVLPVSQEGAEVTLKRHLVLSGLLSLLMCITRASPSVGQDNQPLTQGAHLHPKHPISIKLLQIKSFLGRIEAVKRLWES